MAIYRSHLENLSKKTSLTVEERTIWANEMMPKSIFLKKDLRSFIAETKYLDFINHLKEDKFIEASKKIIILRGTFIIKGIIIFLYEVKNLIINQLKSIFL